MTAIAQTISASLGAVWRGQRRIDWVLVLILAIAATVAAFDPARFSEVLGVAANALAHTSIYIAVAVGLMAYLKATGAEALVAKAFEGDQSRMILLAALFGGLAPFCSCEVIPFIAALLALGAPIAAVMAFWLSSPLIDPPTALITAGALGWEYAAAKAVSAVAIGLMGGFALRAMIAGGAFADPLRPRASGGGGSCCGCGPSPFKGKPLWAFWREEKRIATFRETSIEQAVFLLRWLALAYMLEAVMVTYVPAESVAGLVGGEGLQPILISALVGMPAYLNGYAAPALVSGLVEQGMQPGAALTFLVAGAVSCIPAMAAVFSLVKRPVFVTYVAFGLIGAVLSGIVFQLIVG